MKKLLLLLIFAICVTAWRSESLVQMLGIEKNAPAPQSYSIQSLTVAGGKQANSGMSLTEYAARTKTDPDAYRNLFQSHQQEKERSEVDKLMNFFAHLKYE